MARSRDPFSLALEDLRERATRGRYAPGRPVVIIEEARRLGLSTTPVREALAWLCGEGLMERAPRAGYLSPRLDASLLRDRFSLRGCCLSGSLDLTAGLMPTRGDVPARAGKTAVRELFDRIVRETGNRALIEAFDRVEAQLRMLGEAEERIFPDLDDEARDLLRTETTGTRAELRDAVDAYHRRRIEHAAVIVLTVERYTAQPAIEA